ncbi:MAG: DUF421 domain-containing protein [Rubrivivax sp.]|nr:DUF421 domain-containing protein [Rubrivivax sp.]
MFQLSVPWWEFIVRGVVVYAFLLVFLRLTGRRNIGQYDPFDLVLLLILSNAVQNSMNAGDNSLVGGLISALTLIGCHLLISQLAWSSPRLARLLDGAPRALIRSGQIDRQAMRSERLTLDDVHAALRAAGCLNAHEVQVATIETNGQITVVLRNRSSAQGLPPDDVS